MESSSPYRTAGRDSFGRVRVWWIQRLRENGASLMARDVLVVISSFADKKTGQSWPAIETIASTLSVSEKAVKAGIAELRELGILRSCARNKRLGQSNLYCLAIDGEPFQVTTGVTYRKGNIAETSPAPEVAAIRIGRECESKAKVHRKPSPAPKLPLDEAFLERRRAILRAVWDLWRRPRFRRQSQ